MIILNVSITHICVETQLLWNWVIIVPFLASKTNTEHAVTALIRETILCHLCPYILSSLLHRRSGETLTCTPLVLASIWSAMQLWQYVCRHGNDLGSTYSSVQIGQHKNSSLTWLSSSSLLSIIGNDTLFGTPTRGKFYWKKTWWIAFNGLSD